jgi:DNA-binding winged helix-turn-helix (wHTH) protein
MVVVERERVPHNLEGQLLDGVWNHLFPGESDWMKQFESFALDTSNECLWHDGVQIALAPKLFSVLRYLVDNPGRLVTHDELLDALWPATYVQPQVLRTYMLELRKVLGDDAKHPRFIRTLPKRGFSFVAAVREQAGAVLAVVSAPKISTRDVSATELVGRDEDLARLKELAQLAESGQRQLVFITGEAGIGKTALINALREALRVTSPQARVACGHCVEGLSGKQDYHPLLDAFGPFFTTSDRENGLAASSDWRHTFQSKPRELCEALEELAREKALVLVIEDVQWAHESTLEFMSALARRATPAKLMVLATYRPQDRSTSHYLKLMKQDLVVRHVCTELALAPLSKQALRQLLMQRLEQEELPIGLDSFIYQRSAGNPLIVLALLEHMIAERFLVRNGAKGSEEWVQVTSVPEMEISVPNELAKLIELEIDRLNPREQRVLEAGSLMDIAFPVWAVAAALEEDSEYVEELCDDLERRTGLVRRAGHDDLPDGTRSDFYSFAHEFYREVLYQRQTTARRAKGHTRIAERLRVLFAGREANVAREMAMHYEAAGNWPRTVSALRAAARHAHERHAYYESTQLLEHALRLADNVGDAERGLLIREIDGELERIPETIAGTRRHQRAS